MKRNKTWIKGFTLAALMPLFAACSSEDDSPVQGGEAQEVQVSISTRATTDGNTWTWQNGDAINLYVTGYGSTSPTPTTLTYTNGAWSTFNATLPATVEACYPATETATLTSFTIPTDQSTGIAAADYMTTASSQQLNGTDLSLTLEHRLCKVTVTINKYEDYTGTPTVTDERFSSYPTISYSNGSWTGIGSITNNITPLKTEDNTDGKHTYQAIIAPGSYSPFMTLTVNGRSRTVNCDQALVSGNAYTFTLTVSNNELTLTPTDVLPGWGAEEQEQEI